MGKEALLTERRRPGKSIDGNSDFTTTLVDPVLDTGAPVVTLSREVGCKIQRWWGRGCQVFSTSQSLEGLDLPGNLRRRLCSEKGVSRRTGCACVVTSVRTRVRRGGGQRSGTGPQEKFRSVVGPVGRRSARGRDDIS